MTDTFIISAENNNEDVTDLVKHIADKVDGVTVETKENGSIRMTGNAKITVTRNSIQIN